MGTLADVRRLFILDELGRGPSWFARSLYWRAEAQSRALRLGDLCSLEINYYDLDNVGYGKTATEVSSDSFAPHGGVGVLREAVWGRQVRR